MRGHLGAAPTALLARLRTWTVSQQSRRRFSLHRAADDQQHSTYHVEIGSCPCPHLRHMKTVLFTPSATSVVGWSRRTQGRPGSNRSPAQRRALAQRPATCQCVRTEETVTDTGSLAGKLSSIPLSRLSSLGISVAGFGGSTVAGSWLSCVGKGQGVRRVGMETSQI